MADAKALGGLLIILGAVVFVLYIIPNYDTKEIISFINEYGRTLLTIIQIVLLFICGLFRKLKSGLILCVTLVLTVAL